MLNVGRNEEEETKKFWEAVEREAGRPVLEHALGQYIGGFEDYQGPVWGLLYLTDERLYFRHFASANWFSSIISSGSGKKRDEEFTLELPVSVITEVEPPKKNSFWESIFRPKPSITTIHYSYGGISGELLITIEHRSEDFRKRLKELVE